MNSTMGVTQDPGITEWNCRNPFPGPELSKMLQSDGFHLAYGVPIRTAFFSIYFTRFTCVHIVYTFKSRKTVSFYNDLLRVSVSDVRRGCSLGRISYQTHDKVNIERECA